MTVTADLEPGDWAVAVMGGPPGQAVKALEWLNGYRHSGFQHALIHVGGGYVVQAEPGGATRSYRGIKPGDLWSTGLILPSAEQREKLTAAALGYVGTGYSWADYAALALHRLNPPLGGRLQDRLRGFIADSRHMICSQLVDQCCADAGVHLFKDDRWPGYVTPSDLAGVLINARKGT